MCLEGLSVECSRSTVANATWQDVPPSESVKIAFRRERFVDSTMTWSAYAVAFDKDAVIMCRPNVMTRWRVMEPNGSCEAGPQPCSDQTLLWIGEGAEAMTIGWRALAWSIIMCAGGAWQADLILDEEETPRYDWCKNWAPDLLPRLRFPPSTKRVDFFRRWL